MIGSAGPMMRRPASKTSKTTMTPTTMSAVLGSPARRIRSW